MFLCTHPQTVRDTSGPSGASICMPDTGGTDCPWTDPVTSGPLIVCIATSRGWLRMYA